MKFIVMYLIVVYVVWCADDVEGDEDHSNFQRWIRSILFPITLTSWFRSNNERLHRLLTILWTLLIFGWGLSLLADRL
jgi:hypothetical protein